MSDKKITIQEYHEIFMNEHPDIKEILFRIPRASSYKFNIQIIFKNGFEYNFTYFMLLLFGWDYTKLLENTYRNAWIKQYIFPPIKLLKRKE